MQLAPFDEYDYAALGLDEGALDGPFLLRDGSFGLLVSLRGRDGGAMPTPGEIRWRRDVPQRVRDEAVHVFLRVAGGRLSYLGTARVTRRGQPARDGFKVAFGLTEPLAEARWRDLVAELTAPPPPAPEEGIAALTSTSTTADRLAAMRLFASRWWGCAVDAPAATPVDDVPGPLADLHGLLAGHAVCAQNRLVVPEHRDGKLVFYVENQGVCVWATEPGDDPPVYVRQNEQGAPWRREADTLSGFLVQVLVHEAVFGAPFDASQDALGGRDLARLAKHVLPLPSPLQAWTASKTRFFGSNGVVGFAFPNGNAFDVWLGAKDRVRLEPLEDLVGDWANVGF